MNDHNTDQDLSSLPLFSLLEPDQAEIKKTNSSILSIFCWNIANPSLKRAEKQAPWLRKQNADVLVLTETKLSEGCQFLENYFGYYGYKVSFPKPEGGEYGVMIATKHKFEVTPFSQRIDFIPSRVASISLSIEGQGELEIIGVYVPSRDASPEKIGRKKAFLDGLLKSFQQESVRNRRIFCGDLNILEPDHYPHYSFFQSWEYHFYSTLNDFSLKDAFRHLSPNIREYSWVGREGDGYRYDHLFASTELIPVLENCYYLHDPRHERMSDHSAIISKFRL